MIFSVIILLLCNIFYITCAYECGYESCHPVKKDMLNVHIIAHSHDDVGWLKTVDQYYYGDRNDIQRAGVQYILDSVLSALENDASRRFIYVETAFLHKWLANRPSSTRDRLAALLNEGRLQMAGGGWTMNDEACTHYSAIIHQMALGLRYLQQKLGRCSRPQVAWQIDPFGHSKEQANLFAQMGFDGLLFGRLDYEEHAKRRASRTLENIWLASPDLNSQLFTSILPNLYQAPHGYCFDTLCGDSPMMDSEDSVVNNIQDKVQMFRELVTRQSKFYLSNHTIITLGDDFNYQNAEMYFHNIDLLIKYVNREQENGSKINLIYSTPACYLKALFDSNITWPIKEGDYLPYASESGAYWTGFYTSRPSQKYLIRRASAYLQTSKQMDVLYNTFSAAHSKRIDTLARSLAVNQHHDAVTGTEKQHVADDYVRHLYHGVTECDQVIGNIYHNTLAAPSQHFCHLWNTSVCQATEEMRDGFHVTLYNPLTRPVDHLLSVPVSGSHDYTIQAPDGKFLECQMHELPESVLKLPGRNSSATHELLVFITNIPATGYVSYLIRPAFSFVPQVCLHSVVQRVASQISSISRVEAELFADFFTHLHLMVNVSVGWYGTFSSFFKRPSGAYSFSPNGPAKLLNITKAHILAGPLVKEYRLVYNEDWVTLRIRFRLTDPLVRVDVDYVVGPLPDYQTTDVVIRYFADLQTSTDFYTDSNGRQMMKRHRRRGITENYYPVNTRAMLSDNTSCFAVLTDRSQGGASLAANQMELMVHRRTRWDDGFGVGEPLQEMEFGRGLVTRGWHALVVDECSHIAPKHRLAAHNLFMSPQLSVAGASTDTYMKRLDLGITLPDTLHMPTLERINASHVMVRLENIFQRDEMGGKAATVDLLKMFPNMIAHSVRELVLTGDRALDEIHRLPWKHHGNTNQDAPEIAQELQVRSITVKPMQIRTFVFEESTAYLYERVRAQKYTYTQ